MDEENNLICACRIRKSFIDILSKNENFIEQPDALKHSSITFLCYYDKNVRKGCFFIANRSEQGKVSIDIKKLIPEHIRDKNLAILYAPDDTKGKEFLEGQRKYLEPYEFLIRVFNKLEGLHMKLPKVAYFAWNSVLLKTLTFIQEGLVYLPEIF